jgi:pimeloyl-ACP methyl ester carboxylesterase
MAAPEPVSASAPAHDRSRWVDLDGPTHYLDFGGPADGPVIVCVHGLGGSAINFLAIAPLLTDRYRVFAPDLAGHGLTQSHGRDTMVLANRRLLHQFAASVAGGPVILMGNSMGGMISLLEATAAPECVAGLILLDPALPMVPARPDPAVTARLALLATPGVGLALMAARRRMSPEAVVASTLKMCCVDPARVPADVVAEHVALARRRAAFTATDRDMFRATRSTVFTAMFARSLGYRRGMGSIKAPVLLIHGERDRLVPLAGARSAARANPAWTFITMPDIGHIPQLEAPRRTADIVLDWLDRAGRTAVEAATPRHRPSG